MRYLGVDPGGRRMGLALGDDVTGIATPFQILPYNGVEAAADLLLDLMVEHRVDCVVIGLPTRSDGSRSPACARTEKIAEALRERHAEVALQPEFLTTNEARRRAREAGLPPTKPIDHFAAQVLLEEFLINQSGNPAG